MHVTKDHWLSKVRRVVSPNVDPRPDPQDIALLVIHNISLPPGKFGGPYVDQLFQNNIDESAHASFAGLGDQPVSSHLFISRRGRITQYVPFDQRAWHAGISQWRGRVGCNDFGIGIELEGTDTKSYTKSQYRVLQAVVLTLLNHYPRLAPDALVGHNEIAAGRKTDPGPAFDWAGFVQQLTAVV